MTKILAMIKMITNTRRMISKTKMTNMIKNLKKNQVNINYPRLKLDKKDDKSVVNAV